MKSCTLHRVVVSNSIVNAAIRTIFNFFLFLRKILQRKRRGASNFQSLRSFCAQKIVASCCFLFACFCFVSYFLLAPRLLCCRIFLKKKKLKIVLIVSFTILLNLFARTYFSLRESFFIHGLLLKIFC